MKLSELQQFCLQKMGIIWFENYALPSIDYLVCVEDNLSKENEAFLQKIMAALHWEPSRCMTVCLPQIDALNVMRQKITTLGSKKMIVFSDEWHAKESVINEESSAVMILALPSLKRLATDLKVKKEAWQKMQPFISREE